MQMIGAEVIAASLAAFQSKSKRTERAANISTNHRNIGFAKAMTIQFKHVFNVVLATDHMAWVNC